MLPTLIAFVWTVSAAGTPTLWYDEAATVSAATRSWSDLAHLLGQVDLVHGLYYALMHVWIYLFGTSAVALRIPSVIAIALAVSGVAVIARHIAGRVAGLCAGLVLALLPIATDYALEVRSYALAMALATWATYALVRGLEDGRWWWLAYAGLTVALGLVFLFGVLLIGAHAITVAITNRRKLLPWMGAIAGAISILMPFALATQRQKAQVSWIPRQTLANLDNLLTDAWFEQSFTLAMLMWILILSAVIFWLGNRSRHDGRTGLIAVAVPWLFVPLAVLWAVSLHTPMYSSRYVASSAPALALMAGYTISRVTEAVPVRWWPVLVGAIGISLIVGTGASVEAALRSQDGLKSENLRAVADIVHAGSQSGDAVMFNPRHWRTAIAPYPQQYAGLEQVAAGKTPEQVGNFGGTDAPWPVVQRRIKESTRVWLVRTSGWNTTYLDENDTKLLRGFKLAKDWRVTGAEVQLYVRPKDRPTR